ncbi:hypothetical protein BH24ACT3_BH24ACT3_14230 [soil metagenome]
MDNCVKHAFDIADGNCQRCGYAFCDTCLVYSFGTRQPPFCIACAVAAGGVRLSAANRPLLSAKEARLRARAHRRLEKETRGQLEVPPFPARADVIPAPQGPPRAPAPAGWTRRSEPGWT